MVGNRFTRGPVRKGNPFRFTPWVVAADTPVAGCRAPVSMCGTDAARARRFHPSSSGLALEVGLDKRRCPRVPNSSRCFCMHRWTGFLPVGARGVPTASDFDRPRSCRGCGRSPAGGRHGGRRHRRYYSRLVIVPGGYLFVGGRRGAPGNPPGDATARVPTGAPSGCRMSVCSGTTLSSASGAPRSLSMREPVARLEGAISSPASQEVAGAGSGAASSQGSRLGGGDGGGQDGGDSTPVSMGQDRSVTRAQSAPVMEDAAASTV